MSKEDWAHLGQWLKTAVGPDDQPHLRDEARAWGLRQKPAIQIASLSRESVNRDQRTLCPGRASCVFLINKNIFVTQLRFAWQL